MSVEVPEYLSVGADQLGQGVPVKVRVVGDMDDVARDIARVMLETVEAARKEGRSATLIVPVGPVDQYPVLAEMINRERSDWRDVMIINMDEYLTVDDQWVDLDHPQYYNGGKGTLERVMRDPAKAKRFAHLKAASGDWVVRDDVWVQFKTGQGLKKGPLTIGFTGYAGRHHMGQELQFGHVIGDAIDEQVLLIKTAWGGKSLYQDFRPPGSGGQTGPFYRKMLEEVREALDNLSDSFPAYDGRGYEIAGFVWFQGWNDMVDTQARAEYEQNLVNLTKDVRKAWGRPELPVVIGELGNGGPDASPSMLAIRKAQAAAAARPEFKGTVAFVETSAFSRPREQSPNVGHGHHWFGNAESYFLIGDALGQGMKRLVDR